MLTPIELDPSPPRHDWRDPQLTRGRRPDWLRVRPAESPEYRRLYDLMRRRSLHTVCEEAGCPNIGECWGRGTATFLLLGDTCTRSCGFCKIKTGRPTRVDVVEPLRVARSVQTMGLRHAVLTSVNRDELPDGGAFIFAATMRKIRELVPSCTIEALIPDFMGNAEALHTIMREHPDILNHNTETVPRLYRRVRPQAKYERSLEVLRRAKAMDPTALDQIRADGRAGRTLAGSHRRDGGTAFGRCRYPHHRPVSATLPFPSSHRALLYPR